LNVDFSNLAPLEEKIGQAVAVSDWLAITQERVTAFAEVTGDDQWIHVNPARAAAESPFRTTIAHGFLTLSLVTVFAREALSFAGLRFAVNYGLNRVRFITPVPTGSRIRGRFAPLEIDKSSAHVQVTWNVVIEREGVETPCASVEWVVRYYPGT
jgi:acyl dehydratase